MARPTKFRKVDFFPRNAYFVPLGKEKCNLEETVLKVEELQAMRLKDMEGLTQEECAAKMQISRQTFQNIIDSARKKVTIALSNGNAIKINGGDYTTNFCKFKCFGCGNIYEIKYEQDRYNCPNCGDKRVVCNKKATFCKMWCRDNNKV